MENIKAKGIILAATGVFIISFDALLVRIAGTNVWNIIFWRGIFMGISLTAFLILRDGVYRLLDFRNNWIKTIVSSAIFVVSGAGFVLSVENTTVANTVVILSMAPLFAALFTRTFLGEPVSSKTWIAMIVSLIGVIIIFQDSLGSLNLKGDIIAVITAASMGLNLTFLRKNPELKRTPIVCISGFMLGFAFLPLSNPFDMGVNSYIVLGAMGLFQMPLAMIFMASATRYISSPEAGMFQLIESVLGPVWVWLAIGEKPPKATFIGGAIILLTLFVYSYTELKHRKSKQDLLK